MREQISELQVTYNTLRQNREIQAYDLLVANQSKLEEKSYMSNVPLFVAELDKVEYKYGVNLTGFAYSNGSISTSIMAETGEIEENKDIDSAVAFADIDNSNIPEEAYKKLVSMIGDFRDREDNNMVIVEDNMETTNEEKIEDTTGEIFDLEFIGNYSGNEVISTNIELNVK